MDMITLYIQATFNGTPVFDSEKKQMRFKPYGTTGAWVNIDSVVFRSVNPQVVNGFTVSGPHGDVLYRYENVSSTVTIPAGQMLQFNEGALTIQPGQQAVNKPQTSNALIDTLKEIKAGKEATETESLATIEELDLVNIDLPDLL